MTDRLRRLDALFAERVLGLDVATIEDEPEPHVWVDRDWILLPHYTRSLDAAWEGARQYLQFPIIEICLGKRGVHVEVERDGYEDMGDADHPAEALVLACLRACGVSEEELK